MQRWHLYGERELADKYDSEHFGPGSVEFDSSVLLYFLGWLKIFTIFIWLKYLPSFLQCVIFCPLYSKTMKAGHPRILFILHLRNTVFGPTAL